MRLRASLRRWSGALAAPVGVAIALAAPAANAEWVDWIAEVSTGFEYDNNLNRSSFDTDTEQDFAWVAEGRGGRIFQVSDRMRLSLAAKFASAIQFDFDDLNRVATSGEVIVSYKFGVGPGVPVLRVFGSAGWLTVDDSDRSGGIYESGLSLTKRFTERFDADVFFAYTARNGGSGDVVVPTIGTDVWDQENIETGANFRFLILPNVLGSIGYTYRDGEFASQCTTGNVATVFRREGSNVEAIARDKVFGGCTYRLDGDSHRLNVNLNYGFGRRFAVDVGYQYLQGKADELIYRSNVVRISLLYRY